MATTAPASSSRKEYLKKYESNAAEEDKKKKKKKRNKTAVATGVLVVDEDPVWQKPVKLDEEEENDSADEKPLIDEDINVKRMKRLEQLRARRAYNQISDDGSGWVSVSDTPKGSTFTDPSSDMSPPRNNRVARYDTPSLEPAGIEEAGLFPSRQRQRRNDSPEGTEDLSPPCQRRRRYDSLSPEPRSSKGAAGSSSLNDNLSPPRRRDGRSPSVSRVKDAGFDDMSPPRKRKEQHIQEDLSPPRKRKEPKIETADLSPQRKRKEPKIETADLSPPRKRREHQTEAVDLSPPRKRKEQQRETDLSPPRKKKEQQKTGLITGRDVGEEIAKTKKDEWSRFKEMDPSTSGRGAEPVYRIKGERVSKDEYLKLKKKKEKPKEEEKKLEWGKGLAQKREAEARVLELELEKEKPFARSRDDPELDRMMKDRLRWGDPMAHLVKQKQYDAVLPDLGENEKMKESGFIVPQEIPSHSWIKRRLDFEPNRYGIKPGRHWDGVNRSNGTEKQLFKRSNDKQATEREAYLWSVSDM